LADDIFLKLAGISGASQDPSHKGEIDVLAWSWGLSESQTQAGAGAGAGKANFQDLSIQKLTDVASPALVAATAGGTHISDAILTVRKAGKVPQDYLVLNMQNVMVTSMTMQESKTQDGPQETIMIKYGSIGIEYTPFKADGTKESQVSVTWDVVANKAV
jgi:type VI secretion system secreted protein Hcp